MARDRQHDALIHDWTRAGVLFNVTPARQSPDPERLLLAAARRCAGDARLFVLAVTWLSEYSTYIARHRLKRLAVDELEAEHRAALGLLLDSAIDASATGELRTVLEVCNPVDEPRPLFTVDRADAWAARQVEWTATDVSRRWGLWVQPFELKREALRPATWIIAHNPEYRDRALRRGDLRCTIIEVLKRDAPGGVVKSELALSRLCCANRTEVRRALDELAREGQPLRAEQRSNSRGDQPIVWHDAA